jgi:hypothetical protein
MMHDFISGLILGAIIGAILWEILGDFISRKDPPQYLSVGRRKK